MFDPTAFDNLKTVIEGAVYDLDLDGTVAVVARRDLVDLARFSRTYDITFRLREDGEAAILCKIALDMELSEIAQELLDGSAQSGCHLSISFFMPIQEPDTTCPLIEEMVLRIWGETRIVRQTLRREYPQDSWHNEIKVQFGRLIREENVDDLLDMVPYMLETIRELQSL